MGRMKEIFTDIQECLMTCDYVQLMECLEDIPDEQRGEWLLDTIATLANWQREDQERLGR